MSSDPNAELLAFQKALAGRYSIEGELGRGGMGIVYLAREVALDRMVALKLLPPEAAARPGVRERFLTEARTAARLAHPNIVPIHAVDEVDDFVFFAMAYIDGGTLGDRVRERGPLSATAATRLLREVAWALGHAHLQGVVHRDVKPDNILLDAESGRAMVTDFGIAVVTEEGESEESGTAVGTAEFMSPEQARGSAVDARSDLYSLGCLGYYAISGRVPFADPSPSGILVKHLRDPAPPLLSVSPHAPTALAAAVDRCLRKDPEQRFEGGQAFADALASGTGVEKKELPLPLRVFVKQSRDWETPLALAGLVLSISLPLFLLFYFFTGAPGLVLLTALVSGLAMMAPPVMLGRYARSLLGSGYSRDDAVLAMERDVERREEEFRFQWGERETWVDWATSGLRMAGLAAMLVAAVLGVLTMEPGWWDVLAYSVPVTFFATLVAEARARLRGDVMGERLLRFWDSRLGGLVFEAAGRGLGRIAPAASGMHRPTEMVIGLEADRLFAELPSETRRELEGLPETVEALEADARTMREKVAEMKQLLAEIGDDDPTLPNAAERARVRRSVVERRDAAADKLTRAVAALETIRLGLLHMHAGSGTLESLTMELEAARDLSEDMEHLLEGHREVERILDVRRKTGRLELVTTGEH